MNRREFLGTAAAAPLVYGLRDLLGQDLAPDAPAWFAAARAQMRRSGREGVVCVIPASPQARLQEGRAWCRLLQVPSAASAMLFSEGVFVFLSPGLARTLVHADAAAGDSFVIGADGEVAARGRYETQDLLEAPRFAARFGTLLHGENAERLKARAGRRRAELPAELRDALDRFDAEDPDERSAASSLAKQQIERVLPCLAWIAESGETLEARSRAGDLLVAYYRSFKEEENGPRLPYGATLPRWIGRGCGRSIEELPEELRPPDQKELCAVACGMAVVRSEPVHTFVTFLSK